MRRIWHWDRETGALVEGPAPRHSSNIAPFVWGSFTPFESPATGKWITSRVEHREDLARSGCRVVEAGEREPFKPVNPKYADRPGYDPDYSKEWYSKRQKAVEPEPESPIVQQQINSNPVLKAAYADRSQLHANPHDV